MGYPLWCGKGSGDVTYLDDMRTASRRSTLFDAAPPIVGSGVRDPGRLEFRDYSCDPVPGSESLGEHLVGSPAGLRCRTGLRFGRFAILEHKMAQEKWRVGHPSGLLDSKARAGG